MNETGLGLHASGANETAPPHEGLPLENSRLKTYFFPDHGQELGHFPISSERPVLSDYDLAGKDVMLSLTEEDFILQLSGLEPGEGSRLFWEEAKHVASRPFQPTYDDELFYEAECSGAELIELRKTAYVKLNLDIMRQYAHL